MTLTHPTDTLDFIRHHPSFALSLSPSPERFAAETEPRRQSWHRRRQEIRLDIADQAFFLHYPDHLHFLLHMEPDCVVGRVCGPVLATICALNLRFSLRCIPTAAVLESLLETAPPANGACHLYVFDINWKLALDWAPLRLRDHDGIAPDEQDYDTLRLRMNSRRNAPLVEEVRTQLSRLPSHSEETA